MYVNLQQHVHVYWYTYLSLMYFLSSVKPHPISRNNRRMRNTGTTHFTWTMPAVPERERERERERGNGGTIPLSAQDPCMAILIPSITHIRVREGKRERGREGGEREREGERGERERERERGREGGEREREGERGERERERERGGRERERERGTIPLSAQDPWLLSYPASHIHV